MKLTFNMGMWYLHTLQKQWDIKRQTNAADEDESFDAWSESYESYDEDNEQNEIYDQYENDYALLFAIAYKRVG